MKVALIFLVACLVSGSRQQQHHQGSSSWLHPYFWVPRHYLAFSPALGILGINNRHQPFHQQQQQAQFDLPHYHHYLPGSEPEEDDPEHGLVHDEDGGMLGGGLSEEVQERMKQRQQQLVGPEVQARRRVMSSTQSGLDKRLFYWPSNPFLLSSVIRLYSTSTTTLFTTVSSSLTVASLQSCIALSGFASAAAAGVSTTPCSRRKRRDLILERMLEEAEPVEPSQVEPLIPTALPEEEDREPDISSSLISYSLEDEDDDNDLIARSAMESGPSSRPNRAVTVLLTVTSTVTQFNFSTLSIKKTFTLGAVSVLTCLPPGYNVC